MNFIDDPRKWRLSRSGYSIVTGWGDERKVIAESPGGARCVDLDGWIANAERICDLYNATLPVKEGVSGTNAETVAAMALDTINKEGA